MSTVAANYFLLVLNADGTATVDEQLDGGTETTVEATGQWTAIGPEVVVSVESFCGEPVTEEVYVRIVFNDGFPVISDAKVGDEFIHLNDTGLPTLVPVSAVRWSTNSTGAWRRWTSELHRSTPQPVHRRGAKRAVVAFQESQGLWPDGVLTEETWLALENPAQPLPTPTPIPTLSTPITTIPDLSQLPDQTEDGKPILYLTFDDGPLPDYTPALLDVLEQYDAEVTFFNLGQNVATWPDLVRDATTRGNYIANHTWDHESLEGMTPEQFVSEVERTNQAILDAAGDLFSLDGTSAMYGRRMAQPTPTPASTPPIRAWPWCCGTLTRRTGGSREWKSLPITWLAAPIRGPLCSCTTAAATAPRRSRH
ncbi:MAG: polysaccharide deacetylase family protein [Chloroflexota bacterium]